LHQSVAFGLAKITYILIQHGADVNAQNAGGVTPLHIASQKAYKDIVKMLLKAGTHTLIYNQNNNAPVSDNTEINDLIATTTDNNRQAQSHAQGNMPELQRAYPYAQAPAIYEQTQDNALLDDFSVYNSLYHQNYTYKDKTGKIIGTKETEYIILQGKAPKMWILYATRCGHQSELELLLAQSYIQKSINKIQDANGNRLLHIAAHYNRPTIVTMLLRIADPDLQNNAHQTAHDIISTYNYSLTKKIFYRYKHVDKILQRGTRVDTTDTRKHITDLPPELLQNITHR
jgi:ankyrin repeat protein